MTAPTIDLETFEELQDNAGAEFVGELVQAFLDEAPAMLAEIASSRAAGQTDRFRRAAHSLKSNALTFGATGLAAIARSLEQDGLAAPAGTDDDLDQEYQRVAARLTELTRG